MRITFVGIGYEQLSIGQLSAIAKQSGHDVSLAFSAALFQDRYNLSVPTLARFFDDTKDVLSSIEKQKPDVLAFSALTGTYQWMLKVAREAKTLFPNVKVIFGGVHPSAVPDLVISRPEVDFVCVGEGDLAFPEILKAIAQGGSSGPIPNTKYKLPDGKVISGRQAGFVQDLDILPIYDKPLWEEYIRMGDLYLTMASRGCPYRCTFCFNSCFADLPDEAPGKYVRRRSVDHLLFELKQAKKRYKLQAIDFLDDIFTVDKKWLKEFSEKYKKEINIPFHCLVHAKYMDEEIARWLTDAGCIYVQMGVQTADDDYKFSVVNRRETKEQVEKAIDIMNKYKLYSKVDQMLALPDEPLEAQETARQLYVDHSPSRIATYWTSYFPGTKMLDQALDMKIINDEDVKRINDGLDFDSFRNSCASLDPQKIRAYKVYNNIFKLMPAFSSFIRKRLKPEFFKYTPLAVSSFLGTFIDGVAGLLSGNHGHTAYMKYYIYHMNRFFLRKLGIRSFRASKTKHVSFVLEPPLE